MGESPVNGGCSITTFDCRRVSTIATVQVPSIIDAFVKIQARTEQKISRLPWLGFFPRFDWLLSTKAGRRMINDNDNNDDT